MAKLKCSASEKYCISFLLLVFAGLFLDVRVAGACSCGARPTVLEAYKQANVIVIVRAVSIEKSENNGNVLSIKMRAEKVFKGNLKAGDEMIFAQGGGADCVWTFDEQDIDKQFLFYTNSREPNPKMWSAGVCGRSGYLQYAGDDLLFLNNIDKVRGKTRISGTIEFDLEQDSRVEGRTIRIVGNNKTYEVKTDRNGVYEIYDLPAGTYTIEPETPIGWKVNYSWAGYSSSSVRDKEGEVKTIQVVLKDKDHAGLDIEFEIDNAIRGKVYGADMKPMKGVSVKAVPQQSGKENQSRFGYTDEDGNFAITMIQPGNYFLVVNEQGKISSKEPFRTFYYPNVFEREKARIFTMDAGVNIEGINIQVPEMEETITIEGVFLYSDGKPVVDENVEFEAENPKADSESYAHTRTNADGRFSIKVLKGLKGKLRGKMYAYANKFENCPKLESLIKETGRRIAEIKTPAVEISTEHDLQDVELKYTFPSCKPRKIS